MKDCSVGIDIGTTSVKAIVLDSKGSIIYERSIPHDLLSPYPGFAEEDPNVWWNSTLILLRDIASKVEKIRLSGVGFSGMVPTLIPLDDAGNPLCNSIQQNDARAIKEIEYYKNLVDEDNYFVRTGNTINQQVIFPKIEWLRRNKPEIIDKTSTFIGSYNYCSYKLTGNLHVELNWALESGLWDVRLRKWDNEILKIAKLDRKLLPEVKEPAEIVGFTTKQIEEDTGFPSGVPVIAGSADHIASAFSSGVREEGDLLIKLGGAGDILFSMGSLQTDRRMFIDYHDIRGLYLLNGCMASSGSLVKWFMKETGIDSYDELTSAAERIPAGSDGLIILPYFIGEKTPIFDVEARGVFFGLSLYHTKNHMFRAILEAVAYGFMHHIEVIRDMGFSINRVFMSNGGSKSDLWKKIILDVIGYPATFIRNHPGSSLGAAILAGQALDPHNGYSVLNAFLEGGEVMDYSSSEHEKYAEYFEMYKELYQVLKPLFKKRAEIQQKNINNRE